MNAPNDKPYFTIDGIAISDDGGEVIYQERRKTPLGDHIQANGGFLCYEIVSGTGESDERASS
jgi:hypothetical protein